ncbi:MAG TPA: bifunctional UDP-N-acetylglucosamine diphosphorylase/glucosamine-1-phosphate N-acetyltransferase GlmU [Solirubrobacteraceae bacterium]|jgi:bifunctional UDP-N-acetylglucosamine pyrophosphorylase/glucosamine-1-phosphate N-acetyltransferase|nr:bifunctional UDP-N-acetylglucosamine diphosphorylase/glucosamine-1-phosphate N-acetyltransferase GlmU [Solirubrobacteraceae bacterium]
MPDLTVVVLAAGQGTRMRSTIPKMLHDLCGRPLVGWPIAAAHEAGATTIVVVDSPAGTLAGHLPESVRSVVQPEPNGTGGAVRAAAEQLADGATIVVLPGDAPLVTATAIAELVDAHASGAAAATMATMTLEDPAGYGRVVRDADGAVRRVVETKAPGDATPEELLIREVSTSIFAFDGAALKAALDTLTPDNAQGELYLPDVLPALTRAGHAVAAHRIADPDLALGVNDRVQLAQVRAIAQRRIHDAHGRNGVTIVDPASTLIDVTVTLGEDTVVEPSSFLRGTTTAGRGCRIGPLTTLIDAILHDGVAIPHSYVVAAEIGDQATVGPFAYLRPGTHLRERSKAGTFVEIKNSDVGAGSKVPHLSYIGDADIGEETNLGAATITANYDGTSKHRTTIGDRVHTGVDTTLVAPVTLGDDTWTGANSAITKDVPARALAIARERQTNYEGYADRRLRGGDDQTDH